MIRPLSPPFLTVKGSSVTTIASLPPFSGSTWAPGADLDRAAAGGVGVADPLAAHDPAAREVGALDVLHQARQVDLRVVDVGLTAADTSRRLCGGMLVAIPTAIPEAPLTSRFGNRAGRISGSLVDSS